MQHIKADGKDHHRAAARDLRDGRVGQQRRDHVRQKGKQTLIHEHGHGGKQHAQPQRDGQHTRRNAVKQGFCEQQLIVLLQTGVEAAEDRHRAHAEQERRRHKALGDGGPLPAALEAALDPAAEALNAPVEIQKRPHGGAEHH